MRSGEEADRIQMSAVNNRMEMGSTSHCSVPPYPRGVVLIFGKLVEGYVNIPVRFVRCFTPPQPPVCSETDSLLEKGAVK
jgi:hypothetical protein